MGRTKDEKLVYFQKLKELIETYRELRSWGAGKNGGLGDLKVEERC